MGGVRTLRMGVGVAGSSRTRVGWEAADEGKEEGVLEKLFTQGLWAGEEGNRLEGGCEVVTLTFLKGGSASVSEQPSTSSWLGSG